jgi:hypothetical protein
MEGFCFLPLVHAATEYDRPTEDLSSTAGPMKHAILDAVKRRCRYNWLANESKNIVVPAKAGTHVRRIPACAGMTRLPREFPWVCAHPRR